MPGVTTQLLMPNTLRRAAQLCLGKQWKGGIEKQTFLFFTVTAPRHAKQRDKNTVIFNLGRSLLLVLVALSQALRATAEQ